MLKLLGVAIATAFLAWSSAAWATTVWTIEATVDYVGSGPNPFGFAVGDTFTIRAVHYGEHAVYEPGLVKYSVYFDKRGNVSFTYKDMYYARGLTADEGACYRQNPCFYIPIITETDAGDLAYIDTEYESYYGILSGNLPPGAPSFSTGGDRFQFYNGYLDQSYVGPIVRGHLNFAEALRSSSVPEPSVWAMMIAGFVGVGLTLRATRHHGQRELDPALT